MPRQDSPIFDDMVAAKIRRWEDNQDMYPEDTSPPPELYWREQYWRGLKAFLQIVDKPVSPDPVLPKTTWLKVNVWFEDRNTGEARQMRNAHMRVILDAPNQVLFQDETSGTHRLIALQQIMEINPVVEPKS